MKHLSIDLETFSSVPIEKTDLYKYVQSSDFEILLPAYSVDDSDVRLLTLRRAKKIACVVVRGNFKPRI